VDVDFIFGFDNAEFDEEVGSFVTTVTLELNDFVAIVVV
jgi:hypothetical protein